MIKLGVIGYPLKHTLSPPMHNEALKHTGIEGVYKAIEILPENLEQNINNLVKTGYKGFNVTIPFKIEIIKYLNYITDEAKAVGAVNTVLINKDGTLSGDNTDIYGFKSAFTKEDSEYLKGKNAAVIGSGGAARASGAALIQMQLKIVNIITRYPANAQETVKILTDYSEGKLSISAKTIDEVNFNSIDILINASPLGMYPDESKSPVDKNQLGKMVEGSIVYDLIYRPQKTMLLDMAERKGLKIYGGTDMLVLQGAKAFELWTGKKPPVDIMRKALLEKLNNG